MQCLSVMAGMISTWTVNEDAMARECGVGHLAATDVADYLAKRGLPFREAHAVVGHLVLMCEKRGCNLEDLPFEVFQEASPLFEHDITEALDIPSIVAARTTEGGTAPAAVAVQLQRAEHSLSRQRRVWIADQGRRNGPRGKVGVWLKLFWPLFIDKSLLLYGRLLMWASVFCCYGGGACRELL